MKTGRTGTVLAMTLVVLVVLVILGLALMARTRLALDSSTRERDRLLALNAAEAGANLAVYLLESESDPAGWTNLLVNHSAELINVNLGNSKFDVQDLTWVSSRVVLVRCTGYSKTGRSPQARTVAVKVRMIPSGWRYALWSGESIYAGGNSKVYGSIRANGSGGIMVDTFGSFKFYPMSLLDSVDTPGAINDASGGIPSPYENPGAPRDTMPGVKYTDFQSPTLFPNARIFNVLPADATHPATDIGGGVLPVVEADGTITWRYTYKYSGQGQVNDEWTVAQFNTAYNANPTYFAPGTLPNKDYAIVNWRTGVDLNADGVIDNYRLHLSGNGTITSTIAIYGDSGDPLNPNDNGSFMISGGPTFEPVSGVAVAAHGVDFSKVVGNAQFGTQAHPALTFASGWSKWSSGGNISTVGSLMVNGDGTSAPDIQSTGSAEHWFNPGFIDTMPENMALAFKGPYPPWAAQWLTWQVL